MNTNEVARYVSVRDFMKLCPGISEKYIRDRIKEGTVPGFTRGKRFKINCSAFIELLDKESRERCNMNGGV